MMFCVLHSDRFQMGTMISAAIVWELESLYSYNVRIHLTTGESATKHGQAIRMGMLKESVIIKQMLTVNTDSLVKPVGIA